MKVVVIGAGAMGCLFASRLKEAGNNVLLVDHDERNVRAIARNGVRIKENGRTRRIPVNIRKSVHDLRDCELVLVMVKAYDTKDVADELSGRLGGATVVLTLQNGLGNLEILSRRFGRRVVGGSTTEASLRIGPGAIDHTGRGLTILGELDGAQSSRVSVLIRMFKRAGFRSLPSRHIQRVVWSKSVLNSAINPVSALTRLRNGQLTGILGAKQLMLEVLAEGARVARAEGLPLQVPYLSRLLGNVLRSSAKNRSSMLQDVLQGRKTEVKELNGAIASLGRKRRIATPFNEALTSLVMGLEIGSIS